MKLTDLKTKFSPRMTMFEEKVVEKFNTLKEQFKQATIKIIKFITNFITNFIHFITNFITNHPGYTLLFSTIILLLCIHTQITFNATSNTESYYQDFEEYVEETTEYSSTKMIYNQSDINVPETEILNFGAGITKIIEQFKYDKFQTQLGRKYPNFTGLKYLITNSNPVIIGIGFDNIAQLYTGSNKEGVQAINSECQRLYYEIKSSIYNYPTLSQVQIEIEIVDEDYQNNELVYLTVGDTSEEYGQILFSRLNPELAYNDDFQYIDDGSGLDKD